MSLQSKSALSSALSCHNAPPSPHQNNLPRNKFFLSRKGIQIVKKIGVNAGSSHAPIPGKGRFAGGKQQSAPAVINLQLYALVVFALRQKEVVQAIAIGGKGRGEVDACAAVAQTQLKGIRNRTAENIRLYFIAACLPQGEVTAAARYARHRKGGGVGALRLQHIGQMLLANRSICRHTQSRTLCEQILQEGQRYRIAQAAIAIGGF